MVQQTAVEWLLKQINKQSYSLGDINITINVPKDIIEQAKQTEKEQIEDAHIEGQRVFDKHPHTEWTNNQAEQYYNETYGK